MTTESPVVAVQRPRAVLIGLIGDGVSPSLTPPMHELEGARQGMSYVYRTVDLLPGETTPERVEPLLAAARRLGFTGLNITHPIKQTVVGLLDDLAPSARQVGAVNTVVFGSNGTIGHNTDVTGFGAAFDDATVGNTPSRIVLVGAGGAGAAVASALAARPLDELVIVDVDRERAESLVASTTGRVALRAASIDDLPAELATADGVVNATPFGMAAHPGTAFDPALLREGQFVADLVYRPVETVLLREAVARGCRVMSGLGMAMHQAADAFEIFTGKPADRQAMLADLHRLVAAEASSTNAPGAPMRGEVQ